MLQQVHKFFIPKGTVIKNYTALNDLLKQLLNELQINNNITDNDVVLNVGVTIHLPTQGVKPEW